MIDKELYLTSFLKELMEGVDSIYWSNTGYDYSFLDGKVISYEQASKIVDALYVLEGNKMYHGVRVFDTIIDGYFILTSDGRHLDECSHFMVCVQKNVSTVEFKANTQEVKKGIESVTPKVESFKERPPKRTTTDEDREWIDVFVLACTGLLARSNVDYIRWSSYPEETKQPNIGDVLFEEGRALINSLIRQSNRKLPGGQSDSHNYSWMGDKILVNAYKDVLGGGRKDNLKLEIIRI